MNAYTGEAVSAFGKEGEIDMVVPYESAPLIYKNLVIAGTNGNPGGASAIDDPEPPGKEALVVLALP